MATMAVQENTAVQFNTSYEDIDAIVFTNENFTARLTIDSSVFDGVHFHLTQHVVGNSLGNQIYLYAAAFHLVDFDASSWTFSDWSGDDVLSFGGGDFADRMIGSQMADQFVTGGGIDTVSGGEGNDYISGGMGNDILNGDAGDDRIYAGWDDDLVRGGSGNDLLYGEEHNDRLFGGLGADVLYGGTGDDLVHGDGGNDQLYNSGSSSPSDKFYGDGGADILLGGGGGQFFGGAGADELHSEGAGGAGGTGLFGGTQGDTLTGDASLFGGAGNDMIYASDDIGFSYQVGGLGADQMFGGFAEDVFILRSALDSPVDSARDHIANFTSGEDHIDLSHIMAGQIFIHKAFSHHAGEVRFNAPAKALVGDIDGDGSGDYAIELDLAVVVRGDLIL